MIPIAVYDCVCACVCVCVCVVVRHLNDLYKSSVASCRGLSGRLEHFFSRKHLLMDHVSCIRAERLLFSHTVHMVGSRRQETPPGVLFIRLKSCPSQLWLIAVKDVERLELPTRVCASAGHL